MLLKIIIYIILLLSFSAVPQPANAENDPQIKKNSGQTTDAIQPYSENPWYWQYKGEPVLLIGGSNDDNLFQWTGKRLTDHLNLMASLGGNYVRNTMSDRGEGNVYAFKETDDGTYNLDEWNNDYWNRLKFFLEETQKRDIIVQLTLWDHFDLSGGNWDRHPWNPANNINLQTSTLKEKDAFYGGSVYDSNEEVLAYQQKFIDKLLSVSLRFDNVLYNINNEGSERKEWDNYWASYIKQQAEKQGREIHVTSMIFDPSSAVRHAMTYRDLYSYAEIAQNNQDSRGGRGPAHYENIIEWRKKLQSDPMPMNNVKVYGSGVGDNFSAGSGKEATDRFWKNIFAGSASSRFHRPEGSWGIGLEEHAQINLKAMSMLLGEFDVFQAVPHNDLLSSYVQSVSSSMEAYCMADIGNQYAVYFPEGRYTIDLDPWIFVDELRIKWLNIDEGTWSEEKIVPVQWEGSINEWGHRAKVRLTTPGNESYVALLEVVE